MFNQAKFRGGYSLKFISAMLFAVTFLVGGFFVANTALAAVTTIPVSKLDPSWTATGGGGVFSAYVNPSAGYISPGTTAVYDRLQAGIIKAGQGVNPGSSLWDEGLFGFIPNVTIEALAAGNLTYDVQNQYGENPVWMTIEIDTGTPSDRNDDAVYQFVPTTNPTGWHTVNAGAGLWQKWTSHTSGTADGPLMSLSAVASNNTNLNVTRVYLRLGMGDSYYYDSGTVAYVDKVIIGDTTYDFVIASADTTAPTVTSVVATTPGTIVYTFDEAVQLMNADKTALITPNATTGYTSSLGIYNFNEYVAHVVGTVAPNTYGTITNAVLSNDNKTLTITYTGSLVKQVDTDYVVDAWGLNITDALGNKMLQNVNQKFTVNASAPTQTGPIDLRTASQFVVLAKDAVTTTGATSIVGDVGLSPAAASFITGFGLTLAGDRATSSLVTGNVYAADYAPTKMTTAINDMMAAYTAAAAGQPNTITPAAGNIGGMTLAPGVYKWSTDLIIPTDVTLTGDENDVWIFQIAGNLSIASATKVLLLGGALAKNVFWQVGGPIGATLGTTSTFNGTILSATQVILQTGAVLNGRAFAQTQVVLDNNTITAPGAVAAPVTPVMTTTNATGIHENKVYREFKLMVGGTAIDLSATNVTSITVLKPGEATVTTLTPDTDSTMWFNVQNPAGDYKYTVVDKNNTTYEATLAWAGATTVSAVATGQSGDHNGTTYVEYALGNLDLSSFDAMYEVKADGSIVALEANTDKNLWFNAGNPVGSYTFLIKQGDVWSKAVIAVAAPVNGTWSAWSPTESSCGTGTFTQTRTCEGASNGGTCDGSVNGTIQSQEVEKIACTPGSHGNSSGSRPATPAVPAKTTTPDGCAAGNKFSTTTGRNCNAATPAVPASQVLGASTGPIPGCGNRTTGFSVATGESCVGNSTGQVLGAEKFNFTKFLKFKAGSYKFSLQGAEVIELQKLLTSLGYDLGIADGKFGPKTEGAVIKFQIANGLKGDGVVGALTRAELNK